MKRCRVPVTVYSLDGVPRHDIIRSVVPQGLPVGRARKGTFSHGCIRPSRECALHEAGRSVRAEFGHISMGAVVSSVTYAFPWLSTPIAVALNAVSGKKARRRGGGGRRLSIP